MRTVFVNARQVVERLTKESDAEIPGGHEVLVNDDVPDEIVAGVALDVFHTSVAVDCLDDFEFTVTDEDGNELLEPDGYVSCSGADRGELV